jgi:hypothetical protein
MVEQIERIWNRGLFRLLAGAIAAAMLASAQIVVAGTVPAQAQAAVAEFRVALEPHGRWQRHARWGEVWAPANVAREWRPYTVGRWVHTEEWGWYWDSDDAEADWGWVAYHYGRWVFDRELGWVWIPGREWGPAWVQWRRGATHIGWAPLPPDEIVAEYYDEPDVWLFVRGRDFAAPHLVSVILPVHEHHTFIHDTVVVNRSVLIRDRGPAFAVNPGIAPAIVAASVGRPLRNFDVRPRVLAGTAQIRGAVEVRSQDLRAGRRERAQVTETKSTIRPVQQVPRPQPLAAGERGRLGDTPPRAAKQEPKQPAAAEKKRRDAPKEPTTAEKRREAPKEPTAAEQRRGAPKEPTTAEKRRGAPKEPTTAEKRRGAPKEPTTAEKRRGAPKEPTTAEKRRDAPKQPTAAEKRREAPKQPTAAEQRRGAPKQPPAAERREGKQPPATVGRGAPKQQPPAKEQRREPAKQPPASEQRRGGPKQNPATEGRGTQRQQIEPQRQQRGESPGMRQPQRPQATEGRGVQQQSPQRGPEGRGAPQQRPQATEGRGGQRQQPGGRGQQKEAR